MGFNLKILKYNFSIAMALTGIYFYSNPDKIPSEVVEEIQVIKKKIILKQEKIEVVKGDRKPSSIAVDNVAKKEKLPKLLENDAPISGVDEDRQPKEEFDTGEFKSDPPEKKNPLNTVVVENPVELGKEKIQKDIPKELENVVYGGGGGIAEKSSEEPSSVGSKGGPQRTLHSPVISNHTDTLIEDNSYTYTFLATDQDGDRLNYSITTAAASGVATIDSLTGVLTYTPNLNYNGSDTFIVTVEDGTGRSATSFVSLGVLPVNDIPTTSNSSFSLNEDSSVSGSLVAEDVDGDTLTYSIVSQGSGGMVVITNTTTGAFTYVPNGNYNGVDTFTFKVNDGTVDSNTSSVTTTVLSINDEPILDNISDISTQSGQLVSTSVVINDPDSTITCSGNLVVTSSDTAVMPVSGISFSGTVPNCIISLTPNVNTSGIVAISVALSDLDPDPKSVSKTFNLTVTNPPSDPSSLVATLVSNKINLSWTASATGSAITYNIFRGTSSGALTLLTTTVGTAYEDALATAGIEYFYHVSASNSFGSSGYTSEVAITSLGDFAIDSLVSSSGKINVSFTSSAGASSYDISYGTTSGTYSTTLSNQSSPKEITLSGGQVYYLKVRAINSYGYLDSLEGTIYVPEEFTSNFDFNNSLNYGGNSYSEISGGSGQLKASNLVTEKTVNGTGVSGEESLFDNYTLKDSNLDLTADKITMTSGFSGTYISKALDQYNSVSALTGMKFLTETPYGKEISLSAETGYVSSVTDFSNQLVALYRFNASSYSGAVGELVDVVGSNNGKSLGTVTTTNGIFNRGAIFNGLANYFEVPSSNSLDNSNKLTISTWFYPTLVDGNPRAILSKRVAANNNASYSIFLYTGNRLFIDIDGTGDRFSSNRVFTANKWYHVVLVYDGTKTSSQRAELYINGVLDKVATESSTSIPTYTSNLYFGAMNLSYGTYLSGTIDETAIWKKTFTSSEVSELYRRGANRVKFQVRTCTGVSSYDCSTGTTSWVGPDGTSSTYFSELNNNLIPSTNTGLVGSSFYQPAFSLFTGGFTSWLSTGTNSTNQYVQYKAVLESDSTTVFPSLSKVFFTPMTRYSVSSTVFSLSSSKISYKKITQITITHSCGDANSNGQDDDLRYEFSFDGGSTYVAWNGSSWISSTSFATASTKNEINSLTTSEFGTYNSATQDLWVRAYLTSSGLTACGVDNIEVKGLR